MGTYATLYRKARERSTGSRISALCSCSSGSMKYWLPARVVPGWR